MRRAQRSKTFDAWLEAERAATAGERWVYESTMRGGCTDEDLARLKRLRAAAGTYFKMMMADIAVQVNSMRQSSRQPLL